MNPSTPTKGFASAFEGSIPTNQDATPALQGATGGSIVAHTPPDAPMPLAPTDPHGALVSHQQTDQLVTLQHSMETYSTELAYQGSQIQYIRSMGAAIQFLLDRHDEHHGRLNELGNALAKVMSEFNTLVAQLNKFALKVSVDIESPMKAIESSLGNIQSEVLDQSRSLKLSQALLEGLEIRQSNTVDLMATEKQVKLLHELLNSARNDIAKQEEMIHKLSFEIKGLKTKPSLEVSSVPDVSAVYSSLEDIKTQSQKHDCKVRSINSSVEKNQSSIAALTAKSHQLEARITAISSELQSVKDLNIISAKTKSDESEWVKKALSSMNRDITDIRIEQEKTLSSIAALRKQVHPQQAPASMETFQTEDPSGNVQGSRTPRMQRIAIRLYSWILWCCRSKRNCISVVVFITVLIVGFIVWITYPSSTPTANLPGPGTIPAVPANNPKTKGSTIDLLQYSCRRFRDGWSCMSNVSKKCVFVPGMDPLPHHALCSSSVTATDTTQCGPGNYPICRRE